MKTKATNDNRESPLNVLWTGLLFSDEDSCEDMCDNDPDCVAYNYERRDQLACELNDQLALKYGENLKPAPGWDYYEKHRETREYNSCDGIQYPSPGT